MVVDYLNIFDPIIEDNSIESLQYSEYAPQSQNNLDNPGGTILIEINASDDYLMPAKRLFISMVSLSEMTIIIHMMLIVIYL